MAKVANGIGYGALSYLERTLGWSPKTVRKGKQELEHGSITDRFDLRGRKRVEFHLPELLDDVQSILDPVSQADPTFRTDQLYSPLTAKEVRRRLVDDLGYADQSLPTVRTIRSKLNELNFKPSRVQKSKPIRKIPETDAIFERVHQVNETADQCPQTLRLSMDCKAVVKVGNFSRGGKNRQQHHACDHDFKPTHKLTPFGILNPQTGESYLWMNTGSATADFMADCLEELLDTLLENQPNINRVLINADNGPENSGSRTQWLKRVCELSEKKNIPIELAYYPPYHSKYNPVERLWGILENHWNGEIIDSCQKAIGLAKTMTFKGINPVVKLVEKTYKKGMGLSKAQMKELEPRIQRHAGLEKWAITIQP